MKKNIWEGNYMQMLNTTLCTCTLMNCGIAYYVLCWMCLNVGTEQPSFFMSNVKILASLPYLSMATMVRLKLGKDCQTKYMVWFGLGNENIWIEGKTHLQFIKTTNVHYRSVTGGKCQSVLTHFNNSTITITQLICSQVHTRNSYD